MILPGKAIFNLPILNLGVWHFFTENSQQDADIIKNQIFSNLLLKFNIKSKIVVWNTKKGWVYPFFQTFLRKHAYFCFFSLYRHAEFANFSLFVTSHQVSGNYLTTTIYCFEIVSHVQILVQDVV